MRLYAGKSWSRCTLSDGDWEGSEEGVHRFLPETIPLEQRARLQRSAEPRVQKTGMLARQYKSVGRAAGSGSRGVDLIDGFQR
jgi:hypothetical protein